MKALKHCLLQYFSTKQGKDKRFYIVYSLFLLFLCTNCGVKKHINYGDALVSSNEIVFEKQEQRKVNNKNALRAELSTLIKQKPNSRFAFLFRTSLWAHYQTNEVNDTSAWKKFLRRRLAQKPTLYNSSISLATATSMQNYLNSKGYFEAKVTPDARIREAKKTAKISYKVHLGPLYMVDSLRYITEDKGIEPIIKQLEKSSLLSNKAVDSGIYSSEVRRITDSLRNRGYIYFNPNYIQNLEGDSTANRTKLAIDLIIRKPSNRDKHQIYTIGKVRIYPDFQPSELMKHDRDQYIDGYRFTTIDGVLPIKAQVLLDQIYLKPGELYRQSNYDKTFNQLYTLGVYKFVQIPIPSEENAENGVLDFDIYLTRAKRQELGFDADLNNSLRSISNSDSDVLFYLGTSLSLNYRNRNAFKGGELLVTALEGGVEFNLSDRNQFLNTLDVQLKTDVYFPKLLDPFRTWKLLNRIRFGKKRLLKDSYYQQLQEQARSRISISYSFQDYINFYRVNSFNLSFGYDLQPRANERYIINQTGFYFFNPDVSIANADFQTILANNPILARSFSRQLFTGLFYRDFAYVWSSPPNRRGEKWQVRVNQELSGAEILFANVLTNNLSRPFEINSTRFAHYTRAEFDLRFTKVLSDANSIALRLNTGIAVPFGGLSQAVPFVKQHFLGGPSSIRAWRIRELGPGRFHDQVDPPFYQTGNLKLEFNAEYRFDLIRYIYLKGAFFLDGGNIWTLQEDPDRPGAKISSNFLQEIALGGGFGFRFDLSFFVVRLDMGYKLRTPYLDNDKHWQLDKFRNYNFRSYFDLNNVNYNLALGLPF